MFFFVLFCFSSLLSYLTDDGGAIENHERGCLELVSRAFDFGLGDVLRETHRELYHRVSKVVKLLGIANTMRNETYISTKKIEKEEEGSKRRELTRKIEDKRAVREEKNRRR